MVYIRGNPLDFERWQDEGAGRWGYANVLPFSRRAEARDEGGDAYHGDSGPLHTRHGNLTNPMHAAWTKAAAEAGYHPCGTCRIGRMDDPLAVVDSELKVIGLAALRVVDSSVMPSVTTGNLNAPTIMIGEKGADHIMGKPLLATANAEYHIADSLREGQR